MLATAVTTLLISQSSATLLYQPKVGAAYRFSVTSSIKNQTGTANITARSDVKILSRTGDYYRVQTQISDIKTGGKAVSGGPQKNTTILDYDKYGALRIDKQSTNGGTPPVMGSFNNQALGMQFPKKPVKVGETWSNSVDLGSLFSNFMKQPGSKAVGKVNLVFKLTQLTAKAAVVSCTMKGTINMQFVNQPKGKAPQTVLAAMSISGNGQYTVERSSGVYLASNMAMNVVSSTGGRHIASNQTVSMKRI